MGGTQVVAIERVTASLAGASTRMKAAASARQSKTWPFDGLISRRKRVE